MPSYSTVWKNPLTGKPDYSVNPYTTNQPTQQTNPVSYAGSSGQPVSNVNFYKNPDLFTDTGTVSAPTVAPKPSAVPIISPLGTQGQTGGKTGGSSVTVPPSQLNPQAPTQQGLIDTQKQAAEAQKQAEAERLGKYTSSVNDIYAPIFQRLSEQLGSIPGLQAQNEQGVNSMYDRSAKTAGDVFTGGLSRLSSQKDLLSRIFEESQKQTNQTSQRNLADISDTATDAMKAAGMYLGSRGAGSSSATQAIGEKMSNEVLKARGREMDNRSSALQKGSFTYEGDIQKVNDAEAQLQNTYQQQATEMTNWRDSQLMNIKNEYAQAVQNIKNDMTIREADKAQAIQQATQGYYQTLSEIDANVTDFVSSLQQQAYENEMNLDNYRRQIDMQSQVSGNTSGYSGGYSPTDMKNLQMVEQAAANQSGQPIQSQFGYMVMPEQSEQQNVWEPSYNNGIYQGRFNSQTGQYEPAQQAAAPQQKKGLFDFLGI